MSEMLRIPADECADMFVSWINDATEQMENDTYQLQNCYAIAHEVEVIMAIYDSLQNIAIERNAEMDVFVRHAIKKYDAAYAAAIERFRKELFKEPK